MNSKSPWFLFVFFVAVTFSSGIACHWIFEYSAGDVPVLGECYCTATIYRELPGGNKFAEPYETDLWPVDMDDDKDIDTDDAELLCSQKIDQYIIDYMNPGFTWKKQNISIYPAGPSEIDKADCPGVVPLSPTYGAPSGSALSWPATGRAASVLVTVKGADGSTYSAQPSVKHALVRLAEHRGGPDQNGDYQRDLSQIRVSHFSLDLDDFDIGGGTVKEFHVNNIGTIATDGTGINAKTKTAYVKVFLHAVGAKGEETKRANDCYATDNTTLLGYSVFPTQFVFHLDTSFTIGGALASVVVSLTSNYGAAFNYHQPYVALYQNWQFPQSPVALTPYSHTNPDKDEPVIFQWFENFDDPDNERFLGEGMTLNGVKFGVGPHEVAAVIRDNSGAFFVATSTLTVQNNAPPIAVDDLYSGTEDADVIIGSPGVLKNDQDPNGDAFTASLASGPAHGTVSLNPSGSFTYKPARDFNGPDTFSYTACDLTNCSGTATVTINVAPVNDAPVAKNDSYTVDEDAVLAVAAGSGVLNNDLEVDGDTMTAQQLSATAHGTLDLHSSGAFEYVPTPSYHGTDSFTYQASDGKLASGSATVSITVVDLPPEKEIPNLPIKVESLPLNDGQKNSLDSKLDAALAQVKANNKAAACGVLKAFLNELQTFVQSGLLSQSQAQPLIDKVKVIMGELGCK